MQPTGGQAGSARRRGTAAKTQPKPLFRGSGVKPRAKI